MTYLQGQHGGTLRSFFSTAENLLAKSAKGFHFTWQNFQTACASWIWCYWALRTSSNHPILSWPAVIPPGIETPTNAACYRIHFLLEKDFLIITYKKNIKSYPAKQSEQDAQHLLHLQKIIMTRIATRATVTKMIVLSSPSPAFFKISLMLSKSNTESRAPTKSTKQISLDISCQYHTDSSFM